MGLVLLILLVIVFFAMGAVIGYAFHDGLIAHARDTGLISTGSGTPEEYFNGLALDVQRQAHVMFVLQENDYVARYEVTQPDVPAPTLGPRVGLHA